MTGGCRLIGRLGAGRKILGLISVPFGKNIYVLKPAHPRELSVENERIHNLKFTARSVPPGRAGWRKIAVGRAETRAKTRLMGRRTATKRGRLGDTADETYIPDRRASSPKMTITGPGIRRCGSVWSNNMQSAPLCGWDSFDLTDSCVTVRKEQLLILVLSVRW